MRQLSKLFTNDLFILVLYLVVILVIVTINEMGSARADVNNVNQPTVITTDVEYLRLSDAPPDRDITKQRFAPLEAAQ